MPPLVCGVNGHNCTHHVFLDRFFSRKNIHIQTCRLKKKTLKNTHIHDGHKMKQKALNIFNGIWRRFVVSCHPFSIGVVSVNDVK